MIVESNFLKKKENNEERMFIELGFVTLLEMKSIYYYDQMGRNTSRFITK